MLGPTAIYLYRARSDAVLEDDLARVDRALYLTAAMSGQAAYNTTEDMDAYNRVQAVERAVGTRIEHSYVQTPAGDVHRAATLVRDAARDFVGSYRTWIEPLIADPDG